MPSESVPVQHAATTVDEVCDVLRAASSAGRTVLPVGNRSTVDWLPGPDTDEVLSLRGLDGVLEHSAGDLVVHVQAGTLLSDLQAAVAGAGQHLALSAPVDGVTVGGLLAGDLSGPGRYLYGTVRDLVIGTTSVRSDGAVTHSGGKVVKNVAGYDLGKLYTGSRGTLGVITDAWFRLHPLPESTRWVVADGLDAEGAGRAFAAVRSSQTAPTAIEVRSSGDGYQVAVQVDGVAAGIETRAGLVATLTGGTATDAEPAGWGTWPDEPVLLAVTHSPAALTDVLSALTGTTVTGSAVGVLRVGCDLDRASDVLAAARAVAARHHGTATVLRAPAGHDLDVRGPGDPALLTLMRRVKDEFDPTHTLAPGRLLGDI
ncbi:FAD-binding oxidoreductase [Rhodococcus antarcticus]|jgi:glycolate oxidase FAD binding subunit|uniref:FAD-binding oxidoreductase n=1 Tax=Rhodococcus antarcticus TaxID=2987751 RepID=A0ABY6P3V9_9NOCA|nr:FAD-binding oxidoreductase [Rhodococcus antarcticus]UZJ25858.1 FAD-binding oxidoreductase [Rhodococcus antarcticus]